MPKITATVQIGNSDDKLTQREWVDFAHTVHRRLHYLGELHFLGYSLPDMVWQNACWVVVIDEEEVPELRRILSNLSRAFRQDSIALTLGETFFIPPSAPSPDGEPSHWEAKLRARIAKNCYREVDGYLVYGPPERSGYMDASLLRIIADYLDQENQAWDAEVQKGLDEANRRLEEEA